MGPRDLYGAMRSGMPNLGGEDTERKSGPELGGRPQSKARSSASEDTVFATLLARFQKSTTLMSRFWDVKEFDSIYAEFTCKSVFAVHYGSPDYYSRYRSGYKTLVERFCSLAPASPVNVLDVGGGQLALLCKHLWGDHACVADIGESLFGTCSLKVCKLYTGTCVKRNNHLHSNLTSFSFRRLFSIYLYRVMSS